MINMGIREITDRRIVWILTLSFLLLSGSVLKHAHAQLTKLNVASSGISPTQIVPYLAQEAGIFAKNGLEVSVVRTRADVAVMSMLAGDTALIDVAGPIVIRSGLIRSR
jgi:ABC-type nitrate/sulfonate/bicarbonate transport system substrate-binding protein